MLEDETTTLGALTHADLGRRARRLAGALVARGIAPGDRVALMLPTGLDFFVAFFAILYAGASPRAHPTPLLRRKGLSWPVGAHARRPESPHAPHREPRRQRVLRRATDGPASGHPCGRS
ncbi:AMP-binding protein [Sinorhizobium psoraleae]|uniref:AMP-binding protein n=1 Tax=Sinorhizobium psoraleae TaxID=520838 RepID=UPI0035E3C2E9